MATRSPCASPRAAGPHPNSHCSTGSARGSPRPKSAPCIRAESSFRNGGSPHTGRSAFIWSRGPRSAHRASSADLPSGTARCNSSWRQNSTKMTSRRCARGQSSRASAVWHRGARCAARGKCRSRRGASRRSSSNGAEGCCLVWYATTPMRLRAALFSRPSTARSRLNTREHRRPSRCASCRKRKARTCPTQPRNRPATGRSAERVASAGRITSPRGRRSTARIRT